MFNKPSWPPEEDYPISPELEKAVMESIAKDSKWSNASFVGTPQTEPNPYWEAWVKAIKEKEDAVQAG